MRRRYLAFLAVGVDMQQEDPGAIFRKIYRQFIGPIEDRREVYLGFGLFFIGVGLVLVSIVAFLWSTTYSNVEPIKYVFREIAVTAGASGIPIVLLSTAVLLPVSRRVDLIGTGGVVACFLATAQFVAVYPRATAWNQNSSLIVSVYAIGAIIVLTAAGTALSGYRIEMVANATTAQESTADGTENETDTDTASDSEEISDERVERQIESAMAAAELNWGGVERDDGQTLQFTANEDEYDARNVTKAGVKESRGGSVDDAVEGLQGLRGDKRKTESGSDTSEQATALADLRANLDESADTVGENEAESHSDTEYDGPIKPSPLKPANQGPIERIRRFIQSLIR
jgi:hypothetical protein